MARAAEWWSAFSLALRRGDQPPRLISSGALAMRSLTDGADDTRAQERRLADARRFDHRQQLAAPEARPRRLDLRLTESRAPAFFKVYVAALYLGEKLRTTGDVPRASGHQASASR
jgi:hypothetical protein